MPNFERIIDLGPCAALNGDEPFETVQPGNSSGASGFVTASQLVAFTSGYANNRLFNSNFYANRRTYVSGTALTAGAFGHDRWKAGAAGCTYTFSQTTPDTQITITAGTLIQRVEAALVEGGTYVISWAGTASVKVNSGSALSSPAVVTALPSNTVIQLEFTVGTLGQVFMDAGKVAIPYVRRIRQIEDLCLRRYCFKQSATTTTDIIATLQAISTTAAAGKLYNFPEPMYQAPAISVSSVAHLSAYNAAASSAAAFSGGTLTATVDMVKTPITGLTGSSGLVAGNAALIIFNNLSGYILADADGV